MSFQPPLKKVEILLCGTLENHRFDFKGWSSGANYGANSKKRHSSMLYKVSVSANNSSDAVPIQGLPQTKKDH